MNNPFQDTMLGQENMRLYEQTSKAELTRNVNPKVQQQMLSAKRNAFYHHSSQDFKQTSKYIPIPYLTQSMHINSQSTSSIQLPKLLMHDNGPNSERRMNVKKYYQKANDLSSSRPFVHSPSPAQSMILVKDDFNYNNIESHNNFDISHPQIIHPSLNYLQRISPKSHSPQKFVQGESLEQASATLDAFIKKKYSKVMKNTFCLRNKMKSSGVCRDFKNESKLSLMQVSSSQNLKSHLGVFSAKKESALDQIFSEVRPKGTAPLSRNSSNQKYDKILQLMTHREQDDDEDEKERTFNQMHNKHSISHQNQSSRSYLNLNGFITKGIFSKSQMQLNQQPSADLLINNLSSIIDNKKGEENEQQIQADQIPITSSTTALFQSPRPPFIPATFFSKEKHSGHNGLNSYLMLMDNDQKKQLLKGESNYLTNIFKDFEDKKTNKKAVPKKPIPFSNSAIRKLFDPKDEKKTKEKVDSKQPLEIIGQNQQGRQQSFMPDFIGMFQANKQNILIEEKKHFEEIARSKQIVEERQFMRQKHIEEEREKKNLLVKFLNSQKGEDGKVADDNEYGKQKKREYEQKLLQLQEQREQEEKQLKRKQEQERINRINEELKLAKSKSKSEEKEQQLESPSLLKSQRSIKQKQQAPTQQFVQQQQINIQSGNITLKFKKINPEGPDFQPIPKWARKDEEEKQDKLEEEKEKDQGDGENIPDEEIDNQLTQDIHKVINSVQSQPQESSPMTNKSKTLSFLQRSPFEILIKKDPVEIAPTPTPPPLPSLQPAPIQEEEQQQKVVENIEGEKNIKKQKSSFLSSIGKKKFPFEERVLPKKEDRQENSKLNDSSIQKQSVEEIPIVAIVEQKDELKSPKLSPRKKPIKKINDDGDKKNNTPQELQPTQQIQNITSHLLEKEEEKLKQLKQEEFFQQQLEEQKQQELFLQQQLLQQEKQELLIKQQELEKQQKIEKQQYLEQQQQLEQQQLLEEQQQHQQNQLPLVVISHSNNLPTQESVDSNQEQQEVAAREEDEQGFVMKKHIDFDSLRSMRDKTINRLLIKPNQRVSSANKEKQSLDKPNTKVVNPPQAQSKFVPKKINKRGEKESNQNAKNKKKDEKEIIPEKSEEEKQYEMRKQKDLEIARKLEEAKDKVKAGVKSSIKEQISKKVQFSFSDALNKDQLDHNNSNQHSSHPPTNSQQVAEYSTAIMELYLACIDDLKEDSYSTTLNSQNTSNKKQKVEFQLKGLRHFDAGMSASLGKAFEVELRKHELTDVQLERFRYIYEINTKVNILYSGMVKMLGGAIQVRELVIKAISRISTNLTILPIGFQWSYEVMHRRIIPGICALLTEDQSLFLRNLRQFQKYNPDFSFIDFFFVKREVFTLLTKKMKESISLELSLGVVQKIESVRRYLFPVNSLADNEIREQIVNSLLGTEDFVSLFQENKLTPKFMRNLIDQLFDYFYSDKGSDNAPSPPRIRAMCQPILLHKLSRKVLDYIEISTQKILQLKRYTLNIVLRDIHYKFSKVRLRLGFKQGIFGIFTFDQIKEIMNYLQLEVETAILHGGADSIPQVDKDRLLDLRFLEHYLKQILAEHDIFSVFDFAVAMPYEGVSIVHFQFWMNCLKAVILTKYNIQPTQAHTFIRFLESCCPSL